MQNLSPEVISTSMLTTGASCPLSTKHLFCFCLIKVQKLTVTIINLTLEQHCTEYECAYKSAVVGKKYKVLDLIIPDLTFNRMFLKVGFIRN